MRLIVFFFSAVLLGSTAQADRLDELAQHFLRDSDDKTNPVLPELARASSELRQDVFRNVAEEGNECLGYYYTVGMCVDGTNKEPPPGYDVKEGTDFLQLLKKDKAEMYMVAMSATLAGGLDRETVKSSVNQVIRVNSMKIHNDCGNLSLLAENNKTLSCKQLARYPSDRLRYWLHLLRKGPPQ